MGIVRFLWILYRHEKRERKSGTETNHRVFVPVPVKLRQYR